MKKTELKQKTRREKKRKRKEEKKWWRCSKERKREWT